MPEINPNHSIIYLYFLKKSDAKEVIVWGTGVKYIKTFPFIYVIKKYSELFRSYI